MENVIHTKLIHTDLLWSDHASVYMVISKLHHTNSWQNSGIKYFLLDGRKMNLRNLQKHLIVNYLVSIKKRFCKNTNPVKEFPN